MTVISQIQEYILDKVPAFAQVGVRILIACLVYRLKTDQMVM